ncbi:MAG TPA: hypothetical protein VEC19_09860 [Usitatibacter sp.]|nr:hypothetical protein [Usitatibacter sp.]
MNFKQKHPDFAVIESHIHRARVERAVVVSAMVVEAVQVAVKGLKTLAAAARQQASRASMLQPALTKRAIAK